MFLFSLLVVPQLIGFLCLCIHTTQTPTFIYIEGRAYSWVTNNAEMSLYFLLAKTTHAKHFFNLQSFECSLISLQDSVYMFASYSFISCKTAFQYKHELVISLIFIPTSFFSFSFCMNCSFQLEHLPRLCKLCFVTAPP